MKINVDFMILLLIDKKSRVIYINFDVFTFLCILRLTCEGQVRFSLLFLSFVLNTRRRSRRNDGKMTFLVLE